jgi:hypothetical protein
MNRHFLAISHVFQALLAFCLILLILTARPQVTLAQPDSKPCVGLDIVLIIDQSNSMSLNDPNNLRIDSAREIIHQLGDNRLYLCPDAIHRVSAISFGDQELQGDGTEIDLPFVTIQPDDLDLWKIEREQLKNRVQAQQLGATDFATAFAVARQQFDSLGSIGTLPRKQSIILLTDGGPCVTELGCSLTNSTFDSPLYLRNLQIQVDRDFPFQTGSGFYLWVVAMQDRGADYLNNRIGTRTLREYWSDMATARDGALIQLTKNREDIPATFYEILKEVTGTGKVELTGCTPHFIEPYTERAIFTIFKNRPALSVSIEHRLVDGQVITLENGLASDSSINIGEYSVDGPIERYVVRLPDPGVWTVTSDNCADMQVYRELISPEILLIEPTQPIMLYDQTPFYNPREPVHLAYEIRGRNVQIPLNLPSFPLRVEAEITSPSNQPISRTLVLSGTVFRSTEPLLVNELGEYRINLTGQTDSADPAQSEPVTIFTREDVYRVFVEEQSFAIQFINPEANSIVPLNEPGSDTPTTVPLKLQLVNQEGRTLNPDLVFTENPLESIQVVLTTDQQTTSEIDLTVWPDDPAIFIANLDLPEGDYLVEATVQGEYRQDRFELVRDTTTVAFQRVRAQFFDFEVVEPQPDATLAVNSVEDGTSRLLPVPIRVQLVDATGQTLDPATPFPGVTEPIITAVLQGPSGTAVAVDLQPDPDNPGYFQAQIDDPGPAGEYRLEVNLAQPPTNLRYQPVDRDSRQIPFSRVEVKPFNFTIEAPAEGSIQPLHAPRFGAALKQSAPLPIRLQLTDETGEQILDPQTVLAADLSQAVTAVIVTPTGITGTTSLEVVEYPDGKRLEGMITDVVGGSGDYRLVVQIQEPQPGFAPLRPEQEVRFTRQDTSWETTPWVWQSIGGISLLLIALLIGLIIYLRHNGPQGELELSRSGSVSIPVTLRPYHCLFGARNSDLRDAGIRSIKAKKNHEDINENAINVWVYDTDGHILGAAGERLVINGLMEVPNGIVTGTLRYQ